MFENVNGHQQRDKSLYSKPFIALNNIVLQTFEVFAYIQKMSDFSNELGFSNNGNFLELDNSFREK